MTSSRRSMAIAVLVLPCLWVQAQASPSRGVDGVDTAEVLARFDEVQASIRTLSAEFTETTRSTLLKETLVAKGKVYMTKPHSVRWEYSLPEEMRFVIAEDEYTGYFPQRKQAERRGIKRWREQLFRFLGLGQASEELAKFYTISVKSEEESGHEGAYLLLLDPKRKRVRKRMETVRFWIDSTTYLPVKVEYASASGSVRVIEFDHMDLNPELAANLYTVELPPDVEVTRGFSALSGFSDSPTD